MRRMAWTVFSFAVITSLLVGIVFGEEKVFIQPCSDDTSRRYYTWLTLVEQPDGTFKTHLAHDYNAPAGTEVKAIADGVVYDALLKVSGFGSEGKPGPLIWIKHRLTDGKYFYALYGHVEPALGIKKNIKVEAGQVIGKIIKYLDAKTKKDTSHLHFGIWNSETEPPPAQLGYGPIRSFTDPVEFLKNNRPYSEPTPPRGIPGGIVAADGKNVIYHDLGTGQRTILVSGNIQIAAIDEEGRLLVWQTERGFMAKIFPDGEPFAVPSQNPTQSVPFDRVLMQGKPKEIPILWGEMVSYKEGGLLVSNQVRNLVVAPAGAAELAFEAPREGDVYIPAGRGVKFPRYPRYICTGGIFTSVNIISVMRIPFQGIQGGLQGLRFSYYGYGQRNPVKPYEVTYLKEPYDYFKEMHGQVLRRVKGTTTAETGAVPENEQARRLWEEEYSLGLRHARFPDWSKAQEPMLAMIFQTNRGWGPISIKYYKTSDILWPNPDKIKVPKKIPVLLKNCNGLAWKPDGTITYESEGKIYSADGRVLAEGIELTKFYWITNDIFIYRGKDNVLYCWQNGKREKLLSSVPEEFSYCSQNPLATTGKNKVSGDGTRFYIGTIRTACERMRRTSEPSKVYFYDTKTGKLLREEMRPPPDKQGVVIVTNLTGPWKVKEYEELEFAFPTETNFDDISDPTKYNYQLASRVASGFLRPDFWIGGVNLNGVNLNQVLLLKKENRYAAIKPVFIHEGIVPHRSFYPVGAYMIYEWKYWGNLPNKK